ncbi:hypothetical protein H109_05064 [Trichophyton interdigitale MR816]|uniref:Uncharacterized protein n=1 Tax=Trichophyton interdigitale (strain MR816) TaxID=1215338 RepID=A0A059J5R1_TRIIM|nr:hypothetical protein H101_06033 [Trichophyton interdigitale H6]KDB23038.1 hypothetical protein H109_05064 [Trichophyton interdigitale MR816]
MLQGLGGDGFLQNRVRLDQENASEDPRTGKETQAVKPSQTWSEFAREYKESKDYPIWLNSLQSRIDTHPGFTREEHEHGIGNFGRHAIYGTRSAYTGVWGRGKGTGFGIRYERVRWEIVPFSIDEPREYGRRFHGKGERQEGPPAI